MGIMKTVYFFISHVWSEGCPEWTVMRYLDGQRIGRLVTRKYGEEVYEQMDFSECEGALKIFKCRGDC